MKSQRESLVFKTYSSVVRLEFILTNETGTKIYCLTDKESIQEIRSRQLLKIPDVGSESNTIAGLIFKNRNGVKKFIKNSLQN